MTDDLVKRLRDGWTEHGVSNEFDEDVLLISADRIEELEKALIRVWVLNQGQGSFKGEIDMVVSVAMDGKTHD
jgi:hypothetical protein